jgi:hypothetical protein
LHYRFVKLLLKWLAQAHNLLLKLRLQLLLLKENQFTVLEESLLNALKSDLNFLTMGV